MAEPKTLYAEFTALPGHEDQVHRLVTRLAEQVRQESGNLTFIAHRLAHNPASFFVYEEYADADAFTRHMSAEHGIVFNTELAAHIVEDGSRLTWLDRI